MPWPIAFKRACAGGLSPISVPPTDRDGIDKRGRDPATHTGARCMRRTTDAPGDAADETMCVCPTISVRAPSGIVDSIAHRLPDSGQAVTDSNGYTTPLVVMRWIVPWVIALLTCCGSGDPFPAGLYESCADGGTCRSEFMCLSGPGVFRSDTVARVCTRPCNVASDCPRVFFAHCGDVTACRANVCSYWPCR
jgi:hypothetical protein